MRKRTYLETMPNAVQRYSGRVSYPVESPYIIGGPTGPSGNYRLLPEEYDVFSRIDPSFFTHRETKQQELISRCLTYMKQCLVELYNSRGIVCILPKLVYFKDDEDTITFTMAMAHFRASISFEGEKGNYDAYFCIVSQTDENTVSSETKKLTLDNCETTMRSFLQILINNS